MLPAPTSFSHTFAKHTGVDQEPEEESNADYIPGYDDGEAEPSNDEPISDRICRVTGNRSTTYASFFNAFGRFYEAIP
jgi:hypothetical protein